MNAFGHEHCSRDLEEQIEIASAVAGKHGDDAEKTEEVASSIALGEDATGVVEADVSGSDAEVEDIHTSIGISDNVEEWAEEVSAHMSNVEKQLLQVEQHLTVVVDPDTELPLAHLHNCGMTLTSADDFFLTHRHSGWDWVGGQWCPQDYALSNGL